MWGEHVNGAAKEGATQLQANLSGLADDRRHRGRSACIVSCVAASRAKPARGALSGWQTSWPRVFSANKAKGVGWQFEEKNRSWANESAAALGGFAVAPSCGHRAQSRPRWPPD